LSNVAATLQERGSRYGEFADHAKIAQGLQDVLRAAPKWDQLDFDMKQALTVMCDKFARILNGDPFYIDNWHDVAGYSTLIENRLNMITPTEAVTLYDDEDAQFQEIPEETHSEQYYDRHRNVDVLTTHTN
jgi:hypothetical protein